MPTADLEHPGLVERTLGEPHPPRAPRPTRRAAEEVLVDVDHEALGRPRRHVVVLVRDEPRRGSARGCRDPPSGRRGGRRAPGRSGCRRSARRRPRPRPRGSRSTAPAGGRTTLARSCRWRRRAARPRTGGRARRRRDRGTTGRPRGRSARMRGGRGCRARRRWPRRGALRSEPVPRRAVRRPGPRRRRRRRAPARRRPRSLGGATAAGRARSGGWAWRGRAWRRGARRPLCGAPPGTRRRCDPSHTVSAVHRRGRRGTGSRRGPGG